jgi:hypothetical protein
MNITLDTKSLCIGLAAAGFTFLAMGNTSQSDASNGKFQIEIRDKVVIILNTQNGDYLVAPDMIDLQRNKWIKGEFYKSFKTAKDQNRQ